MKKILMVIVLLLLTVTAFAQQWVDVVYLKNGSIIKGTIIEQVPDVSLKIQTATGNLFVVQMQEVLRIGKEQSAKTGVRNAEEKYDLTTLKWDGGGSVVNEYGTVFTRSQITEIMGEDMADELYASMNKFKMARNVAVPTFLAGGTIAILYLVSGGEIGGSLLPVGGIAAAIGIAGFVVMYSADQKTNRIINDYRMSLMSLKVSPSVQQYALPGCGLTQSYAPGITLSLNF